MYFIAYRRNCAGRYMRFLLSLSLFLLILLAGCGTLTQAQSSQKLSVQQHTPTASLSLLYYQTADSLYAVETSSGKRIWSIAFAAFGTNLTHNQAVVSNGIIYAEATGSDGYYIYALDAVHGTLRWKYRYGGDELQEEGDNPSSLFVGQGVVYLVVGTSALASVGPQYPQGNTQANPMPPVTTTLYKFDATTGLVIWKHALSYRLNTPILIGRVLYGIGSTTFHGSLEALNGDDGSLLWQYQLPQSDAHYGDLTFYNGVLYGMSLNTDSTLSLYAFSASNGQKLWQSSENIVGASVSNIGIASSVLYLVTNYHRVYAFDRRDGKLMWQRVFSAYLDNSNLLISNNLLYLVAQNSPDPSPLTLYMIDGLSDRQHKALPLSTHAATFCQLEMSQSLLYVLTLDGTQGPVRMSRYASETGKQVGTYLLPSSIAEPTVAGKMTLSA